MSPLMQASKPAILFIHGAWHQPSHVATLVSTLQKCGYEVTAPALPSVFAKRDSGNGLAEDAAAIASSLRALLHAGKDVVVVMHSYGGICGSEGVAIVSEELQKATSAEANSAGRILHLVYLTAMILRRGTNLATMGPVDPRGTPITIDPTTGLCTYNLPMERLYTYTTRALALEAMAALRPMAVSALMGETKHQGWSDYGLPLMYLATALDACLLVGAQAEFIKRLLEEGGEVAKRVEWLERDHSPFLDGYEEVAKYIRLAAGEAEETLA